MIARSLAAALAVLTVTAAHADMTPAEYFARDRAQQWTGPLVNRTVFGTLPARTSLRIPQGRAAVADLVAREAGRQGVPVRLALAVVRQESGFNPRARSYQNAQGVMQVIPSTWRSLRCTGSPWVAADNVRCGMKYLAQGYREGGAAWALARYHGGPNTRAHGRKTLAYQRSIMAAIGEWPARRRYAALRPKKPFARA